MPSQQIFGLEFIQIDVALHGPSIFTQNNVKTLAYIVS